MSAARAGDTLRLAILDDGPGVRRASPRRGSGVGLANTRARLHELYGAQHTFTLAGGPQGGTEVVITLPFVRTAEGITAPPRPRLPVARHERDPECRAVKPHDALPCPTPALPGSVRAGAPGTPVRTDAHVHLAFTREPSERSELPGGVERGPPLRVFVARFGEAHGLTETAIAECLRMPPSALAAYADSAVIPRWLGLALAGVGTARGIPASELIWLLAGTHH